MGLCETNPYDFNPRTPSGVRLPVIQIQGTLLGTSIHALQAECDQNIVQFFRKESTSIHALQAECDTNNL